MSLQKMMGALWPFAEAFEGWGADEDRSGDNCSIWEHPLGMLVTVADFRRAYEAHALAAATRGGGDVQQAPCEASQSGAKRNAQNPPPKDKING